MKTDILIIGAGPAGIFTALELIRKGYKGHIRSWKKARVSRSATAPRPRPAGA